MVCVLRIGFQLLIIFASKESLSFILSWFYIISLILLHIPYYILILATLICWTCYFFFLLFFIFFVKDEQKDILKSANQEKRARPKNEGMLFLGFCN